MEIFLFFFISSVILVFSGRFFLKIFYAKSEKSEFSLSEQGIFGLIFLSFLSLFLNFFFKLDQNISSLVLIIPLIQFIFEFKKLNIIFFKKFLKHTILISLFCALFISFDNVFRPDAGIYHLPYVKILNDFKIFTGVVSLNPVFGATSILQYTSAIFNNLIFKDIGITIPLAISTIYFIEYFVSQFFKKNDDVFYKSFLFIVTTYIFLEMNRYSEYGNDNPAHLFLFYFLTLIFREDFKINNSSNFKILTLVSVFVFLNKVFLVFVLFVPVLLWLKNKYYKSINFLPIFPTLFFSLWILKNIFISGCAIYPISFTCNNNLSWYSDNSNFIISAKNLSQFSELHAKNWSNIVDNNKFVNYENNIEEKKFFLKNFNWLFSENISNNAKFGFFKIFNNYIFLLIIFISILLVKKKFKRKKSKTLNFEKKLIFIISLISCMIAFYKFPLGRYASSYFVISIFFSLYFILKSRLILFNQKKTLRIFSMIVLLSGSIFIIKNLNRIVTNIGADYYQAPWPRIYENKDEIKNLDQTFNRPQTFNFEFKESVLKIYYVNKLNYWTSDRSIKCLYNSSPCAQSGDNFKQFKVVKTPLNYYKLKLNK